MSSQKWGDTAQPGERPGGGGSPTAERPSTQSSSPPPPTLGSLGREGGCESANLGWGQQKASTTSLPRGEPCLPRMDRAGS